MKTRFVLPGLVFAAALVMTGCGQAGTAPGSTSTSTASVSATETPSAVAKTYTNGELETIVTKLKDPNGQPFTVIPAAQINQGLQVARTLLKTAVVTPKACAVLATENAQVPEGSTYAAGTSISAADKTTITVTVFAVKDASSMSNQLMASQKAAAQCDTVTVAVAGKKATVKVTPVAVTTSGDTSLGALTTETAATGQKVTALTVTAIKGNLAAQAVKAGVTITPAASAELVKLVDAVLANQ